jgi:hypothetical protein
MLSPNSLGRSGIATQDQPFEAGQTRSFFFLGNLSWTPDVAQFRYPGPGLGLFLVGHIIYEDDARIRRQTAFRRKYDVRTERFHRVDLGDEHEYAD